MEALPRKAFGLVSGRDHFRPEAIYPCRKNLRNLPEWRPLFEAYGEFYRDPDRGFVVDPLEYREIVRAMEGKNGRRLIGIFHSHRCLGAEPSLLDRDFHFDPSLVCFIVSVCEPGNPEVRAYHIDKGNIEEIPIEEFDGGARDAE